MSERIDAIAARAEAARAERQCFVPEAIGNTSPDAIAEFVTHAWDDISFLLAELSAATARMEKMTEAAMSAIPTNWCDALLTGPNAVLSKDYAYSPPEIERLLTAIRERVRAALSPSPPIKPHGTGSGQ